MKWTGEKIKSLAQERGLSLKTLAEQTGVSRQTINDWIKGQVPKGNHLISICKIFQVNPDYFFLITSEESTSIPLHRIRKAAKVTPAMQRKALELAKAYELLFRNASEPEFVPVIRISQRNETNARKIAETLRLKSRINEHLPIDYAHTFNLMDSLGITIIFRYFPAAIKSYAFYKKICGHRVIFVNNSTNIIDLIFPILHDAIHAIRDEEYVSGPYDDEEELFCDTVANHIQFPDEYIEKIYNSIHGLDKGIQVNKLKTFSKQNSHSLYGVIKYIKSVHPDFALDVGGADTNLKKGFPTIGDILFQFSEPEEYVRTISQLSPKLISIIINQLDNLTSRKLGDLLGLESALDANAIKEELSKLKNTN